MAISTSGSDRLFVESLGTSILGLGEGDDLYVIDGTGTGPLTRITIGDSGVNRIQLVGGLTIKSSLVASNTMVLILSNDAEITVSNAAQFTYIIGGTPGQSTTGTAQNYTQFVTLTLGAAGVPDVGQTPVEGDPNTVIPGDGVVPPPPVEGQTFMLTAGTDSGAAFTGTALNDFFDAPIVQNPFAGGVSNSLSTADRLNGGDGWDVLHAELIPEFFGATGDNQMEIQPRTQKIEEIKFEAMDYNRSFVDRDGPKEDVVAVVDAKNMLDVVKIGSSYSDGDLVIENLTTKTSAGGVRNTDAITVTMDHTDNSNTDTDASDLHVYFDDNYLLSGQESESQAFFFLLDEDADLVGNPNRLDRINVDGIRFSLDGGTTIIDLDNPDAQLAGTHQGFVNALQANLVALIAAGTVPAGTTLTLDPTITDFTFLDDGRQSDAIPAIVLTIGDGTPVTPIGYSQVADAIGEYDVYGRFNAESEITDQPISVNIELHKVGRGGEGGDLIVGGKYDEDIGYDQDGKGIEVFNVSVLGNASKPSSLGELTSTNGELRVVNIKTDAAFANGETFASLTIRDGFGYNDDLQLVNADAFKGDLTLGNVTRVENLDTLTAQGGGDVAFYGALTGDEVNQAYSYTTGAGDDLIDLIIDGDALDFAGSSLNVSTGAGNDIVIIDTNISDAGDESEDLNQAILDNVTINTGDGDDTIIAEYSSRGNLNIDAGTGNDFVNMSGGDDRAIWAFNFDDLRVDAQLVGNLNDFDLDDLPGVQTSRAFIGGATVTVTLSGAGTGSLADGGGVMSLGADGAVAGSDGYEASATITSLINGNTYYGDQRDINAAVIRAIENDAVLSKLLTATISSNNTLVIRSTTGGVFSPEDLRIDIAPATATTSSYANAVLAEAKSVFKNSLLDLEDLWGTVTFSTVAPEDYEFDTAPGADLNDSLEANAWYDGLSVADDTNSSDDNQYQEGEASRSEMDNVINGGAGNDVIVLSTDARSLAGSEDDYTVSPNNALQNRQSNETIVLTGSNFGNDTVMNFTTTGSGDGANDYIYSQGMDFLDFTAYLTSKSSESGSTQSQQPIPVTLEFNLDDVAANEVAVVSFANSATEKFVDLNATKVAAMFNDSTAFGGLTGNADDEYDAALPAPIDLVNGAAKAVIMIENNANLGEYKVFELSWNGSSAADDDLDLDGNVTATLVGSLDFGTSLNDELLLNDFSEVQLVGSVAHSDLLDQGILLIL